MTTPEHTSYEMRAGDLQVDQLFSVRHKPQLQEVFELVAMPPEVIAALDDISTLDVVVEQTQPWVQGDHFRPKNPRPINPAHSERLYELYAEIGMRDEQRLAPGHYDEIIVPGAVQASNLSRTGLLARMLRGADGQQPLVTTQNIRLLGGQRYLFPEIEKADVEQTFDQIARSGLQDPWFERIRQTNDISKMWETDALRLAAIATLGPIALRRVLLRVNESVEYNLELDPESEGNLDAEALLGYEFSYSDMNISLMHTLAVPRPNGAPRHTTEACVKDWLERYEPAEGARIGFIGGNPHLERMARATVRILIKEGRDDLVLVAAGPAASSQRTHPHYLGEIARSLFEDQRDLRLAA